MPLPSHSVDAFSCWVDKPRQNWQQPGLWLFWSRMVSLMEHTIKIHQSSPRRKFFIRKNSKWPPAYLHNMQIVTHVRVTTGNCFPRLGKYCPTPKTEGNISPTEAKQFPIVTDNSSLCFVIPHSNTKKYKFVNMTVRYTWPIITGTLTLTY